MHAAQQPNKQGYQLAPPTLPTLTGLAWPDLMRSHMPGATAAGDRRLPDSHQGSMPLPERASWQQQPAAPGSLEEHAALELGHARTRFAAAEVPGSNTTSEVHRLPAPSQVRTVCVKLAGEFLDCHCARVVACFAFQGKPNSSMPEFSICPKHCNSLCHKRIPKQIWLFPCACTAWNAALKNSLLNCMTYCLLLCRMTTCSWRCRCSLKEMGQAASLAPTHICHRLPALLRTPLLPTHTWTVNYKPCLTVLDLFVALCNIFRHANSPVCFDLHNILLPNACLAASHFCPF